jgi:hypothetical protein
VGSPSNENWPVQAQPCLQGTSPHEDRCVGTSGFLSPRLLSPGPPCTEQWCIAASGFKPPSLGKRKRVANLFGSSLPCASLLPLHRLALSLIFFCIFEVLGFELRAGFFPLEPLRHPFLHWRFLRQALTLCWGWPGLPSATLLFVLPCVAGMTGEKHGTQPLVEMGAHWLFLQAGIKL